MTTGAQHFAQASQRALPRVVSKEDRLRAFRAARRHSLFVGVMKLAMPLASLVVLGLYALSGPSIVISTDIPVGIEGIDLSSDGLKMINPRYRGSHPDVGRYSIEAEYALQQIENLQRLDMHKIVAEIEHPDKKWTRMSATKGIYDTKGETLALDGDIRITSDRGMAAELSQANIDIKQQLVSTDHPVMLRLDANRIEAQKMRIFGREKRVLFEGGVRMTLYRAPGEGAAKADERSGSAAAANEATQ